MKAVVYKGPFKVAVEDVEDPRIEHPNDVIVRITSTAICGSDLHMYEGRTAAEPGIVFGHENMGSSRRSATPSPRSGRATGW
jgi:glutathione-independent formaldehyde dehydrogenase